MDRPPQHFLQKPTAANLAVFITGRPINVVS
jgi:hypothetical protein